MFVDESSFESRHICGQSFIWSKHNYILYWPINLWKIALTVDWSRWTKMDEEIGSPKTGETETPEHAGKWTNQPAIYLFIYCRNLMAEWYHLNYCYKYFEYGAKQKKCIITMFNAEWSTGHGAHRKRDKDKERGTNGDWNKFCNFYDINLYQLISLMNFIWDYDEGASGH